MPTNMIVRLGHFALVLAFALALVQSSGAACRRAHARDERLMAVGGAGGGHQLPAGRRSPSPR